MRIQGQEWIITDKYLILTLNDPYWGAWKRYGWSEGTEGYSISEKAFNKAKELKKKVLVKNKYGKYEITTSKISRYLNCRFTARDNTELICIPRFAFKKWQEPIDDSVSINFQELSKMPLPENWEETRKKLH